MLQLPLPPSPLRIMGNRWRLLRCSDDSSSITDLQVFRAAATSVSVSIMQSLMSQLVTKLKEVGKKIYMNLRSSAKYQLAL